ncbi:O-antigen polymerase [Prevotella dentasini]|uniref:O-antigen polymerase n=1 Tax=Prevotella dentasini TaxID=589537 RepID=UPI00046AE669|nr:O-antigen polymerase [Prevotella dentasini]
MAAIIIIILGILLATFLTFRIGDIFSPWFITAGVWLAIVVMFQISTTDLYPLQSRFYTCVLIWVPMMSLTGILTYYAFPGVDCSTAAIREEMNYSKFFFLAFYILSIVCTPLYVYKIYKVVSMFGTENLLFNLRILANAGEEDTLGKLLKYINAVNQALFIICVWKYPKISKATLITVTIANLMCAVAIMEKGALFFLMFTALFILYQKEKIKLRSILLWGGLAVFLFYGINILRSSTDAKQTEESTFLDFFAMYILSPPVAFEQVQEKLTPQFGSRSFAFFYAFASKMGWGNFIVEPKLQEFVQVPIPTNVYTTFQPFFEDFGYKGVAFFSSVYGVFTGWLYRQCRNGGTISRCLYAYVVEILVLQFFQENLILSLSLLFQYLIVFTLVLQQRVRWVAITGKQTE